MHDNPDEHIQFKAGKLLRDELLAKSIARLRLTFPQLMELRESLIQVCGSLGVDCVFLDGRGCGLPFLALLLRSTWSPWSTTC